MTDNPDKTNPDKPKKQEPLRHGGKMKRVASTRAAKKGARAK
jgi:hypothetical protein